MYSAHIGRKFLDLYQKKTGQDITPQEFFTNHVFELFYNDKKYFKWVVNSPLVQALGKAEKPKSFEEQQALKLRKLLHKINYEEPDSSFAIGFPAADLTFDTSGQVSTGLRFPTNPNEIYASWIGAGFGLEVEGKQAWLIDDEEILWTIYEGWKEYRALLNSSVIDLKPNDLDAWNSAWLHYSYEPNKMSPKFRIEDYVEVEKTGKWSGSYALTPLPWVKIVFQLARHFKGKQLVVYSSRYIFDKQKSHTVGFVQFVLPEVDKFYQLLEKMFHGSALISNKRLLDLYETQFSFANVAQLGVVGLRAIEPKGLRKFMPGYSDRNEYPKEKNIESQITNTIYISWVLAMLNNKDLLSLAEKASNMLHDYASRERQARTGRRNLVDKLLNSKSRKELVESLASILEDDATSSEICNALVNEVMLNIPPDNVPLFVTLMRFKYALPTK